MSEKTRQLLLSFIIYFFVFLMMVEWLKPVIVLTDTDHLSLFSLYLVLTFVFYIFKVNWKITIPLKLLFIGWVIVSIYTEFSFFSRESFPYLWQELLANINALTSQQWVNITNPFRTFLFFILLWMTAYLLNYWIRVRKNLLLFFIFTVLFITILDTFTTYNGEKSIVITLVSGFILLGLLYAQKLLGEKSEQVKGTFLLASASSLLGLLAISGAFAYVLPKAGPSWPDPVPFFTSTSPTASLGEGIGNIGVTRKVGYGENDEQLGGAFVGDDTPVFLATSPIKQYWKIETKDTYTSKGWVQSDTVEDVSSYGIGETIPTDIPPAKDGNTTQARISMQQDFSFIMQPYGIESVFAQESVTFSLDSLNQKISTFKEGNLAPIDDYEVSFNDPVYSVKALRNTTSESLNELTSEFDRYLQLPDTLPTRVRDLATSITEDDTSLYEKAKSIEKYFRLNGFKYDQKSVAIPKGDTDYVDQFLFDTKVGYCDNFSTSMVVLLRSEGIPARWVKGFTQGEILERGNDSTVYEVTNNNAHSWVEAFIPNVGWVNFEPTIGFSNSPVLDYDVELNTDEEDTPDAITPTPQKPETKKEQEKVSEGYTSVMSSIGKWLSEKKAVLFWWIVGITLVSFQVYRIRGKWIPKLLIRLYRTRKKDWKTFEKMFHQLLTLLSAYGYKKEQGQTLKDFAKQVDESVGGSHMTKLTNAYEKGFYGNNRDDLEHAFMKESWEYLINQVSG